MDAFIDLLINYGYWGMLTAAFLAGSFFPFSSEAVMLGLMAAGLDPITLAVYGTIGNVAGPMPRLASRERTPAQSAAPMAKT